MEHPSVHVSAQSNNETLRTLSAGPPAGGFHQVWECGSIRLTMRYVIAVFALAGAVVSFLALQVHYSTATSPCSINEKWDCGVVNHSSYAVIEGIPVAFIGILGYLIILWLGLARQRAAVLIASLAGLGFSLYLTHIERDVLGVWCLYCVISLGIIAAIPLLDIFWFIVEASKQRRNRWHW
jgi:vitamin-K-epoxide reductase (warfarin-sensitive)